MNLIILKNTIFDKYGGREAGDWYCGARKRKPLRVVYGPPRGQIVTLSNVYYMYASANAH